MTPAEFKIRFPEFAGVIDARIQMFIDDADPMFDVERWGSFYPAGIAYFVAHELTMGNRLQSTASAAVSSSQIRKRVGDVEVQHDSAMITAQAKNQFMATVYGQRYLRYRSLVGAGGAAV